jgi:hypothetical protein
MTSPTTKPPQFDGNRVNNRSLIFTVALYLKATAPKANDMRRILFMLSYITGGLALSWKNQYMQKLSDGKGRNNWKKF